MFTCGEFGCDTKAMKHSAIRLSLSLWAYIHCLVWHTESSWGEWVGGWGWVDGKCDRGRGEGLGRGERKEPSYMWDITKFRLVSDVC